MRAVRGCRDVGPRAAAWRRDLIGVFAAAAKRYGFGEVEAPVLEGLDLYASALGVTSDVVSCELFQAVGPAGLGGGRAAIVLRPEGTAGVARAFGSRGGRAWYAGPMFRYERPQAGRLRQFTQIGAEAFEEGVGADVDCIGLAAEFVGKCPGGHEAELVVNTLGTRFDRERFNAALLGWLKPREGALSVVSRRRLEAGKCMRVLDSKLCEDQKALVGGPCLSEFVSVGEVERFRELKGMLEEDEIPFRVDHMLVRGLDYYSSTAFEFQDRESGRAVCAGGRYDDVQGVSGVGFAAGLERLEEAANGDSEGKEKGKESLGGTEGGVAVFALEGFEGSDGKREGVVARRVVRRLRQAGVCAMVFAVRNSKVGKAVGRAAQSGTRAVVLVGPADVEKSVVQVKVIEGTSHGSRGKQRAVPVDDVVSTLLSNLA